MGISYNIPALWELNEMTQYLMYKMCSVNDAYCCFCAMVSFKIFFCWRGNNMRLHKPVGIDILWEMKRLKGSGLSLWRRRNLFTWASFHITTLSTENVPQRNSTSISVTGNRLQGTHYWFSHQLCRWPCKVKVHCLVCKDTWLKCWKNWKRPWFFFLPCFPRIITYSAVRQHCRSSLPHQVHSEAFV